MSFLSVIGHSQSLVLGDILLDYNDSPITSYADIEGDDQFNILYALEFMDGGKLVLGVVNDTILSGNSSATPNTYVNIFLDESGHKVRSILGQPFVCYKEIVFATLVNNEGLLWINDEGEMEYLRNALSSGFGSSICSGSSLGGFEYSIKQTNQVVRTNNYLTVVSEATDRNNTKGTLHTIIKIDTRQEINNYFIPHPDFVDTRYVMTGLAYLSSNELVASYSARADSLSSFVCFMDRQRNISTSIELEPGFKVNDLILDSNSNIVLAGTIDLAAQLLIIDSNGAEVWKHSDENINEEGEIVWETTFDEVLMSPEDEIIAVGYREYVHGGASLGRPLVVTVFDVINSISTTGAFGQSSWWGVSLGDLYYNDQGNLSLLYNSRHTGSNAGYFVDIEINRNLTNTNALSSNLSKIYPNPTSSSIHIELADSFDPYTTTFKVININGAIVKNGRFQTLINLEDLSAGQYYLVLSDGDKKYAEIVLVYSH